MYGFLCLNKAIDKLNADPIPKPLYLYLDEFVSTASLDVWHSHVEDLLPSDLLTAKTEREVDNFDDRSEIFTYYKNQPAIILDIIEDLFWIGISNLYTGFDSNVSLPYLESILQKMEEEHISLPPIDMVKMFSIEENKGWGGNWKLNKLPIL